MRNVNQKVQERSNGKVRGGWRASAALSAFHSPLLEASKVCGADGTTRSNGSCASRQSALRWVRGRFRLSRVAAYAIVAFVVSISVCPILAQPPSQRKKTGPVHLTKGGKKWVAATLRSLSLEEKVGQMLMGRCFLDDTSFDGPDYKELKDDLEKYHIGSLVVAVHTNRQGLVRPSPLDAAKVANQLQADSKLPLLIAADLERGLASRLSNVPDFPWPMALGAAGNPADAERLGAITAREARAVGIEWALAPVADVNNNPANPVINDRSFGGDPDSVGILVSAFIRGAHQNGLLVTAKHFPGLGDSSTDPHLGMASINGDMDHLNAVELVPFRKAIESGVDSILLAHARVPALDPDPNKIATISPEIVDGFLKKDLGFKGVVLTDALEMRGMTRLYNPMNGNPAAQAAVDAVKAGCDMVMVPTDLGDAFHAILKAVQSGEIPESRIDDSVRKILSLKAKLGLYGNRLVDLNQAVTLTQNPEDFKFAQHVADEAVTLVRNQGTVLPIAKTLPQTNEQTTNNPRTGFEAHTVVVVLAEDLEEIDSQAFEEAFKTRCPDARFFYFDGRSARSSPTDILGAVAHAHSVVVAAYVTHRGSREAIINGKLSKYFGLLGPSGEMLNFILAVSPKRTAVVSFGSPYLIESFPGIQTYICTYAMASTSEISAVKALFGEIHNNAKLPVTLPDIAPREFSVSLPTQARSVAGRK